MDCYSAVVVLGAPMPAYEPVMWDWESSPNEYEMNFARATDQLFNMVMSAMSIPPHLLENK